MKKLNILYFVGGFLCILMGIKQGLALSGVSDPPLISGYIGGLLPALLGICGVLGIVKFFRDM